MEWEQPHFTCEVKGARAKLDRVYLNQHVSIQLNHTCRAYVDNLKSKVSSHRPVGASRLRSEGKVLSEKALKNWVFKHPDFARRVEIEYLERLKNHEDSGNPIGRLLVFKECITCVHNIISNEHEGIIAETIEDKLGWALMYVRACEDMKFDLAQKPSMSFPSLAACGKAHNTPLETLTPRDLSAHIQAVRELIHELAREEISQDLRDLQNAGSDQDAEEKHVSKDSIIKKLKRLSPGEACAINCIIDDNKHLHNSSHDMARILVGHWKNVFSESQSDSTLLKDWLNVLFPSTDHNAWDTGMLDKSNPRWKVLRSHIMKAIKISKCSMPGPDGIPAMAYKGMAELAADVLLDAFEALSSDDAVDILTKAYQSMSGHQVHRFNESILCLLPKKPTGCDDDLGTYYHPGDTRPLGVGNVDNRLLASAARLAWEPILEKWVSEMQRGFLKGRAMLHNVLDIDWAAMTVSLTHEHGAFVLFDFKAAFPSVSHSFLFSCLERLGLPTQAMNFIRMLYNNNTCNLRMHGHDFEGFLLQGGVRQGCPLSPLLFAVCVDILLRMLEVKIGGIVVKAFADDVASVVKDWLSQGPLMEVIFSEFALISNLHLNIKKTVCIPLWIGGIQHLKHNLAEQIPRWRGIEVASKGTYLGFVLGPGKGADSWRKPVAKYIDRVGRWANVGGGKQYAAMAYNIFALSTLLFVAQLENTPSHVLQIERAQVVKMFPGPGNWISAEDCWYMKENFGFSKSAQPLSITAKAAKLRVATLGCHFGVKQIQPRHLARVREDNIVTRTHKLQHCISNTEYLDRIALWSQWYKYNYCKILVENRRWCAGVGVDSRKLFAVINVAPLLSWEDRDLCKAKETFQKEALLALKRALSPQAVERIRNKVERWRGLPFGLTGLPGHYGNRILKRLHMLKTLVAPRVHSAVFTTLWNGWCSHRRFQHRQWPTNKCRFHCSDSAEDSIEHYCRCPTVLRVARHTFRFCYPVEMGLDMWALNSVWLDEPYNLRSLALLIYGTYNAFNTFRYNPAHNQHDALHCIQQHCKQGTAGHPESIKHHDSCWRKEVAFIC